MRPYGEYAHPIGSFIAPVAPPSDPPDGGACVCVSFSLAWLPYVLGALSQLTLQSTWVVNDADEFRDVQEQATTLITMIAMQGYDPMTCGCTGVSPLTRWTSGNVLEVSLDGGETWSPYPEGDPRSHGNIFAPLPLATGTVTQCATAENIVANFTAQIAAYVESMAAGTSLAQIIIDIVATVEVYLGLIGVVIGVISALAAQLFAAGDEAVDAAFTAEVWARLKCNILCNSSEDGTITAANLAAIHEQILEDEFGISVILLNQMLDTLGTTGLTNVGRTGVSTGTGCEDCDPCSDVPALIYDWHFGLPPDSTITQIDETTWSVTSAAREPGEQALGFKDQFDRCVVVVEILTGGAGTFQYNTDCDDVEQSYFGSPAGIEAKRFQWTRSAGSPFTMTFTVALA